MTGNDIIDLTLAAAESDWKRKGFLEKIFTPVERQYILDASSPFIMAWRLWSMKESAYKIWNRQSGQRFFAPQKFKCTVPDETSGQVVINDASFSTITRSTKDYIYTIATTGATSFLDHRFHIPATRLQEPGRFIADKMISHYALVTGNTKNEICLLKEESGAPFLYCVRKRLNIPVSITHHGNYAAYTVC